MLNAVSYLFPRDKIPPEIIRSIMLYCLDCFGEDGGSGKCGTSCMAMIFLSNWINGYGQTGRLPISSKYLSGESVNLSQNSLLRDALGRGGAAVVRVDLEGWHYVLLTHIQGEQVCLFDPYYLAKPFDDPAFGKPEREIEKQANSVHWRNAGHLHAAADALRAFCASNSACGRNGFSGD